jgi:fumarylacetoacetase
VTLANRETRRMLEDGDTVVLRGWAERPGAMSIGFGECRGTVLPAVPAQVGTGQPHQL